MPRELEQADFIDAFMDLTAGLSEIYVGLAPIAKGASRRAGHQIVAVIGIVANGHKAEPHVVWMPWATKKNKLEVSARFFLDMRRPYNVIVYGKEQDKLLFRHMCRLGLMRHCGHIDRFFEDGTTAFQFQTLEPPND